MKPTVLLDVDGILANFIAPVLDHIVEVSGRRYAHDDVKVWDIFTALPDVAHLESAVYDQMRMKRACFEIPLYDGAVDGVARLQELADVLIVTSPLSGSPYWMFEREAWLSHHFGIKHKDIIHARRKEHVDGDIFVDDKVEHVEAWQKQHPTKWALLWDQPYNRMSRHPRVRSWEELHQAVASLEFRANLFR